MYHTIIIVGNLGASVLSPSGRQYVIERSHNRQYNNSSGQQVKGNHLVQVSVWKTSRDHEPISRKGKVLVEGG
jgi:hypothetical protein